MGETGIYKEELNRLFRVIKPNYQGENLNVSLSMFRGFLVDSYMYAKL